VLELFNHLIGIFREFLTQRDDLLLLVPCEDSDVALVLTALRDLDRESASDLFLIFADDFEESGSFVSSIAERLHEEHELTNGAVGADVEQLPPLPPHLFDRTLSPAARLEAGLQYAHSLIDARRGQHFLWAMGPGHIDDAHSQLELLQTLLPNPEIRPWMRGARIVARVPADFQIDQSPLAYSTRVRVRPFTIPPGIHEEVLETAALDPRRPLGDRMQAEVQLAYLDYAHGRLEQAVGRFLKALAFFQWAEIPVMEGLVISGLGDVARQQNNLEAAQHWYSCAIVPAAKDGNPMLMAAIVQNLAAIAFQEGRFADAEERYDELALLKRTMIDPEGLAEALDWEGLSQEGQQAYDRAIVSWEESAMICKAFALDHRLEPTLAHLRRGYEALSMHDELMEFDTAWAA
jgi:tetratricopeptide (TPR) repeat protein